MLRRTLVSTFTRTITLAITAACLPLTALAAFPLNPTPDWTSNANGHVATGGAWADINGDGWLDLVAANGNDMSRQRIVVYLNNGNGTFPANPSWQSSDIDYHGHLDVGDVNQDGWPDVVVGVYLGAAGFSERGLAKLYLNNGLGTLSSNPSWMSSDRFYNFSVALGDADGDGDLDLACACGDDYNNQTERQRIYFNVGGTFESTPSWQSNDVAYALDVCWNDVDRDGDMDVAFCGTSSPSRYYLNAQTTGGGISTIASWQCADLPEYGNTSAFGDWNGDGYPELAIADNNQLGGAGRFKVYANTAGTLATTPSWNSADGGYGSNVTWADLDLDGDPDLTTGRWWGPIRVYENTAGGLATSPSYSSATGSVIENLFWGDVDEDGVRPDGVSMLGGTGVRTFFPIGQAPVHSIDEVRVDGVPLPASAWSGQRDGGWVSIGPAPAAGAQVEIRFHYSVDLDLGVTNWDSSVGNYLFRNTGIAAGISDDQPVLEVGAFGVWPNPTRNLTSLRWLGSAVVRGRIAIYDVDGRLVRELHRGSISGGLRIWEWDTRDDRGASVAAGIYWSRIEGTASTGRPVHHERRIVVLR